MVAFAVPVTAARAADDPSAAGGVPLPASAGGVAVELVSLRERLAQNGQQSTAVQARLTEAAIALDATEQQLSAVTRQVDDLRDHIRANAATAYVRHQATGLEELSVDSSLDYQSGSKYLNAASDVEDGTLSDLLREQQQLQSARDERQATRDGFTERLKTLQSDGQSLQQQIDRDVAELERWGAVPVMGDSQLTGAQLAAWYRSTGAVPSLAPGTTIDDIGDMYVEEGKAEGVRGDLAFAQAIVETGSFAVAAGNNFSGIGVCDSCTGGNSFPTPRDGIRAQIQLLRNYADPTSRASNLRYPPVPGLYGSDADKAAHLYDTFFLKGRAPLWNQMGHGNWATDPTYSPKVLNVYVQMVLYANAHPGG
jgi:hypothetical protein